MQKLIRIGSIAVLIFLLVGSTSQAGTFLAGSRVETSEQPGEYKFFATFGTALHLVQLGEKTSLQNISTVDAGKYGVLTNEVALNVELSPLKYGVGVLAGPDVDWVHNSPDAQASPTVYLASAAGGYAYFYIAPSVKLVAMWRYKFSTETGNLYPSGSVAGAGFGIDF